MYRGFVALWRKSLKSDVWKNPNVWRLWSWCLMKATHKEIEVVIGYQKIKLQPGQLIFGRKQASIETGLSHQTIRTCLTFLEKSTNSITIKPTNKFSVISILNWKLYAVHDDLINQQANQQTNIPATNKQPTTNQQLTTNNNIEPYSNHNEPQKEEEKKVISQTQSPPHSLFPELDSKQEAEKPPSQKEIDAKDSRAQHPAIQIYWDSVNCYPIKSWWDIVIGAIGEKEDDLKLWEKICMTYAGNGWSPKNVRNRLSFFKHKAIPPIGKGQPEMMMED